MDTFTKLQKENQINKSYLSSLEKFLLMCLEIVIFFEVFVYNFTVIIFNKSKGIIDAVTMIHASTKQKIVEHKTTVIVFGEKMDL